MKMTPVLLLLWSGIHLTFASAHLRHFTLYETLETWTAAVTKCQEDDMLPATLYDEEEVNFISKLDLSEPVWLGLHKNRNITWSDGTSVNFSLSDVNVTDGQICEAIKETTWEGYECSDEKQFMCYNGVNYTLSEDKVNWCTALQYCRKNYSDLVSINNETQNERVIAEGYTTIFWIGLMHDNWEWQDKSCSLYRPVEFKATYTCTMYDKDLNFTTFGCENSAYPLCYKGTEKIKLIKENRTWEEAFDYCNEKHSRLLWIQDDDDQKAVEQWLNHIDVSGTLWIGLRQSRVFGFWIWTSDRPVNNDNSNWKNNKIPELPLSNHCGVINTDDYTWSDENCWIPHYFLCEERIVSV